jgi:ATP-dependent helicase Lhr and Lhr-like helicase
VHLLRALRLGGRRAWCDRRLLSRIHRDTLERLRREIEPVTAAEFWRFLACWQHAAPGYRLEGPRGVSEALRQLAGFEIAASEWESRVLPARVEGYRQEWLDEATLSGEFVWGRLWGSGHAPIRSTPVCLVPREDLDPWLALSGSAGASRDPSGEGGNGAGGPDGAPADAPAERSSYAAILLQTLDERGAVFTQELARRTGLLPSHVEMGLAQLIAEGRVTCDSFGGLRRLITAPSRRRGVMKRIPYAPPGRWTHFRSGPAPSFEGTLEFAARRLLERYGVVFRRVLDRERMPVPWRELVRVYRLWELRGEVRGGRFVQRFAGEQYALPEAVETMRRLRRSAKGVGQGLAVSPADPLNLDGILTPEPRVPSQARRNVEVA